MPNYVRSRVEGGTYFFTIVTNGRRQIFHQPLARRLLREAMREVRSTHPWETCAIILLPEHMHMLWRLPAGDADYSRRIGKIKATFTKAFLASGGRRGKITQSETEKGYAGIWQPRFWEHTIRDARDFKIHLDYIHLNPVYHGLAAFPRDWPWSSFHRYVRLGEYESDWIGRVDLPRQVEYFYAE